MVVFSEGSGLDWSGQFSGEAGPVDDAGDFTITLVHLDGYVRVRLEGDLDFDATTKHAASLREVTDLRTRVVLDVGGVGFVDSSGLRFLVDLARRHDGPVRLEGVQPPVRRILEITGLDAVLDLDA
jgi:anti-sigma B factor antagonist